MESGWEELVGELLFLKSTYCQPGECELTSPPSLSFDSLDTHPPFYPLHIVLRLPIENKTVVTTQIIINRGYPKSPPNLSISCATVSNEDLKKLEEEVNALADTLYPDACLFNIVDSIIQSCPAQDMRELNTSDNTDGTTSATVQPSIHYQSSTCCSSTHACTTTATACDGEQTLLTPIPYQPTPQCVTGSVHTLQQLQSRIHTQPHVQSSHCDTAQQEVSVLSLQHIRNTQRYLNALNKWSRQLNTGGWVLVRGRDGGGGVGIIVVLVGGRVCVEEMLKRWKTESIDVDRRGRPCKETLMRVLCQHCLPPLPIHKCGVELVDCTSSGLSSWFAKQGLGWLYNKVLLPIQPARSRKI